MGQAQKTPTNTEKAQQNFLELLNKFDNAMLVTHTGGSPHARPMAVAEVDSDGAIWFITSINAPKISEIRADSELLATFSEGRKYLTVNGRGEVVRDRAHVERVWKESFKPWFKGKDDPNIALLKVVPYEAEYWDNSGFEGVKYALKAAGAFLSGEKLRGTDDVNIHGKVQM